MQEYHFSVCGLLTAGRRRVYLEAQKGAGISLMVEQKDAGISLLCEGCVTYCRKEEGLPGRAEGCWNITPLCVGYLLQEEVYLVEQKGAGISLLCM